MGLKEILGHGSIWVTDSYAHLQQGLFRAVDLWAEAVTLWAPHLSGLVSAPWSDNI